MNDGTLTNDTYEMSTILYKSYKTKRKTGSKMQAMEFEESQIDDIFKNYSNDDVELAFQELKELSFITMDILGNVTLTNSFINYMENRLKNTLGKNWDKLVDNLSKIMQK